MSGVPIRVVRRVISVLTSVLMVAALALACLMVLPTLLGYERYVIVSGSMVPTIEVGSVVYDEVVPVDGLEVGDIITFVPPPEYDIESPVTHRIIQIAVADEGSSHPGQRVFRTQGDANEDPDAWRMVLDGEEQPRVAHVVPYVGYFYMVLQVRWVQVLAIAIPAFLLIVYIVVTLWRISGDAVREEHERAQAAEPEEVSS